MTNRRDFPIEGMAFQSHQLTLEIMNQLVHHSPMAIVLYDDKGQCIFMNDLALSAIGGTKEQVLSQNYHRIESWKENGLYDKALIAINEQQPQEDIVSINTTFGKKIFIDCRLIPLSNNHLLLISYNLAKLQETQLQLDEVRKENEELFMIFKTIVNAINAIVYVSDMDTYEILYANKFATKLFGNIAGKKCFKAIHGGLTEPCKFCTNHLLIDSNGKSTGIHEREFLNTNNQKWYFISNQAIHWPDGRMVRFEMATDITQLKTAEQRVKESEARLRLVFEQNFDAIFWADPATGFIFDCNNSAVKLLERPKEEIIGLHQTNIHPPDKLELYSKNFKKAFEEKKCFIADVEIITKNGDIKNTECTSTLIQMDNQQIMQGVFKDITEKVQMEKTLKDTNAQLIQAEKLTALGGMTAGIAHEISQPLNVIELISQKLMRKIHRNKLNNSSLTDELNNISKQVKKMAIIIDQMRIYARKTDQIHKEEIVARDLIHNSFIFMGEQLRIHGITVIKHLENSDFNLFVDHIRIEQVLMNLIINARYAVEHSGRKDKQIEVGAYKKDDDAIIFVKDNGIGIPDDVKHKIFEPFFTTKDVGQGTGLGLNIAYRIIEEHDGRIEFSSRLNMGTEFLIFLPLTTTNKPYF
jgi:PAS domain S-box-containing protein